MPNNSESDKVECHSSRYPMTSPKEVTSIQPAGRILIEEIAETIDALKGCVTPIFNANEKGEAELLGSGVLIEVAGQIFLCTAKHVIGANERCTLNIDGPSKLEILAGNFYTSDAERDMAVLKLTPEQVEFFQKYSPLPADKIGNQIEASACEYVQIIGFPATKNRKVYGRNEIKRLTYSNGCAVIEINPAKVRLAFEKKESIDTKTRQCVTAPDPHGMSGGAMFGIPVNAAAIQGKPEPKLIGISTDWPKADEVFGTNIGISMALIRDGYNIVLPTRLNPANIKGH
jgi:hypothetical protein